MTKSTKASAARNVRKTGKESAKPSRKSPPKLSPASSKAQRSRKSPAVRPVRLKKEEPARKPARKPKTAVTSRPVVSAVKPHSDGKTSRKHLPNPLAEEAVLSGPASSADVPKKRGRKAKPESNGDQPKGLAARKKRMLPKSLTEEFLEDEPLDVVDEEDLVPDLVDLDPLDAPVLIDPELEEDAVLKPKPAAPPKPRNNKLAPRTYTCAGCGGSFPWVSTEGLCFSCLKRNISQKRNDETYGSVADDSESF